MGLGHRRGHVWAGLGAAALVGGAVIACDSDRPVATPQVIQYNLLSVDGDTVPALVSSTNGGAVTTVVTDMVLSLFDDRTWSSLRHQTVTTNGVPSTELVRGNGSYAVGDAETTFRNSAGDIVFTGVVKERVDSLTNAAGQMWVFER
ncbi:MAG TPA: hypothetical protein VG432_02310 [Gemmatimonadaceae bacterium]|nr:hypothetical protein [Gemmatimonadaceae bacterium]